VFVLFTYIVPILEEVSGFFPRTVTVILFIVGVGLTIGINDGGRLADRGFIGMCHARGLVGAIRAGQPSQDFICRRPSLGHGRVRHHPAAANARS